MAKLSSEQYSVWHRLKRDPRPVCYGTIEIDGIDPGDSPDYCDAYVVYAEYEDGTPLSEEELIDYSNEHPDLVYELALDQVY